jgi:hypothetical protein
MSDLTQWDTATAQWSIGGTTAMVVVNSHRICVVGWGKFLLRETAMEAAEGLVRMRHEGSTAPEFRETPHAREARIRRIAPFGGMNSRDSMFMFERVDQVRELLATYIAAFAVALNASQPASPEPRQTVDFTAPSSGGIDLQFVQPLEQEQIDDRKAGRCR